MIFTCQENIACGGQLAIYASISVRFKYQQPVAKKAWADVACTKKVKSPCSDGYVCAGGFPLAAACYPRLGLKLQLLLRTQEMENPHIPVFEACKA